MSGHELQELVLPGGKLYPPFAPPDVPARRVYAEVRNLEYLVFLSSPQQSPHTGEELLCAKRLGQVVVGTEVEAVNLVRDGVAGGEHDDGDSVSSLPEPFQDTDPIDTWQHDVQYDHRGREL